MVQNKFNFCPDCGSKKIKTLNKGQKWLCSDCGFCLYNCIAGGVGVLIQNKNGEILLEKRAKEPRRGAFVYPGGFVNANETAEEACKRECFEECGIEIFDLKYLCSFPNTYEYKNVKYKTCDIFFTARISEDARLKAQKSEVTEFIWKKLPELSEIESLNLAFESTKKTMEFFLKQKKRHTNSCAENFNRSFEEEILLSDETKWL